MKCIALAASLVILASYGASAQTNDQLVKGATDTANVLNYGMGYNLQRFSPLTQINKDNAKNLVPVWNYSFADDRSEESQPLVYQGVLYVTTHAATMAVDAKTGSRSGRPRSSIQPRPRASHAAASSTAAPPSSTANCSAPRSTPT
jgi:alcohol dehydrogenase (cytochrome c)